ncbi:MAG: methylmalonyl Co-A mutase-associated GTPase MeaB [Chloroflexi bacterium]|nr:methylmalonyl Co-A mutase-associated GTPase MeaB [Chloroflexota bacterium]
MNLANKLNKILAGDLQAAARLMRGIDDEVPDAIELLESIYLHTGRAYIVGVTGAPGAGKSTLLGSLIPVFRREKMKVGVVAIDPTSPFSGGAILGDRVRMQSQGVDKDIFIRSLASRGWKGGLSRATLNTIHVMDAMGKDIIFVESVGSGQGDIDIARVADTAIVVLTPGMGDEIQIMKAGILEVADIFVINKTDRDGAETLRNGLEGMLEMKTYLPDEWRPGIILTEAISGKGIEELAREVLRHREFLISGTEMEKRRKERARLELMMAIESSLLTYVERIDRDYLDKLVDDLALRKTNPRSAALKVINPSTKQL